MFTPAHMFLRFSVVYQETRGGGGRQRDSRKNFHVSCQNNQPRDGIQFYNGTGILKLIILSNPAFLLNSIPSFLSSCHRTDVSTRSVLCSEWIIICVIIQRGCSWFFLANPLSPNVAERGGEKEVASRKWDMSDCGRSSNVDKNDRFVIIKFNCYKKKKNTHGSFDNNFHKFFFFIGAGG